MMQIDGLTHYQFEMLEHMWSLKTKQEYDDWISLLDDEDLVMAQTLSTIVAQECLEQEMNHNFPDAKQVLSKFV